MRIRLCASLCVLALAAACGGGSSSRNRPVEIGNPYEKVDWQTFSHYRADLHLHTLQSDGCHSVNDVVRAYHDAGFSILSITDHDAVAPNLCPTREAATPGQIDAGVFADAPSPYPDPRPPTFPANTTWPWSDFGAPSPVELGMVGIEGAELTCPFHVNSFFNDYGVTCKEDTPTKNEQLAEVAKRGGLAFLNHPYTDRESLKWFTKFYRDNSADSLIGLELAADEPELVDFSLALWDQLLGEVMPARPIWGFGTSDMHLLVRTRFSFTVFLLETLSRENVKEAMRRGQFYSVVGTRILNFSQRRGETHDGAAAYDGTYPELRSIHVDPDAQEISIDAAGYDEIRWISQPLSSERSLDAVADAAADADAAVPWPSGQIVGRGPIFKYSDSDATLRYVRAEIIRRTDDGPVRLLVNPFALRHR